MKKNNKTNHGARKIENKKALGKASGGWGKSTRHGIDDNGIGIEEYAKCGISWTPKVIGADEYFWKAENDPLVTNNPMFSKMYNKYGASAKSTKKITQKEAYQRVRENRIP